MLSVIQMPRKAPKEAIEHRITLGDYERKELKETLDSISYKNYLQPLQSPVISVALLGGGAYLGLAYAFDWWPFKKSMGNLWDMGLQNDIVQYGMAAKTGQLAAWVTNDYETRILPNFNAKQVEAATWLEENKDNESLWATLPRKTYQMLVDNEPTLRANLEAAYQERLAAAQARDAEWAEKQSTSS